ncbi:hypothetical protein FRB94_005362 [Tulasnella sp. JGI-2019a]|nr:hypothetical protein FRB93_007099 [Tulasnella sp. JGI-2019a]KAG9000544.1 hypothetical protein FRB94_005362 [Tulasnella sp. JGI-2019a]
MTDTLNSLSSISESNDGTTDVAGTGGQGTGAIKRSRRQAAFYPMQNKPNNPFSKSAVKRESVMALGSIEHLQHYFTKAGLATKRQNPKFKGLVPALGPSVIPTLEVSTPSPTSMAFELPPLPLPAPSAPRVPYPQVERVAKQTDPEVLKPGLIRDLEETEKAWSLSQEPGASSPLSSAHPTLLTATNVTNSATPNTPSGDSFDVLPVLQTTTRTIRSVRNYLVSLPDDYTVEPAHQPLLAPHKPPIQQNHLLGSTRRPLPPARAKAAAVAAASAAPVPFPSGPASTSRENEPFTKIRKAALDVLSALRLIEESNRIPLSDDAYDSLSVGSGAADVLSMSEEYLLSSVSRSHTPPNGSGSSTITTTTTSGRGAGSLFSGDEDDNESMTSASAAGGAAPVPQSGSRFSKLKPNSGVTTLVPLKLGGGTVQVWADEEDPFDLNAQESPQRREAWDQRLVLGGGWLYKTIPANSVEEQRAVVARYLAMVDEILFGGPNGTGTPLGTKVAHPSSPMMERSKSSQSFEESVTAATNEKEYRRGWQRVKASLPTLSKLRRGRSSLGLPSPTIGGSNEMSAGGGSLRRIASAGMLGTHNEVVAEPEEMARGRRYSSGGGDFGDDGSGLGGLDEEDEEEEEDLGQYEDEELPEWARRDRFATDPLARIHALLSAHLPPHLLSHLPTYTSADMDRLALLERLSDGQLLCVGYNAVVRRSRKQWGFIGMTSIHDIAELEERRKAEEEANKETGKEEKDGKGASNGAKTGWTFRRTENLRLWAAALKLRYLVALAPPSSQPLDHQFLPPPSPLILNPTGGSRFLGNITPGLQLQLPIQPSHSKTLAAMGPPGLFDARVIAKREGDEKDGWVMMLEGALTKWMDAVLRETREKGGGVGV